MLNFLNKKRSVAVHSGSFHADDVFACATLSLVLEDKMSIIRTRDNEIIKSAEYAVDVGGEYDAERNRFDHHQIGGAGARTNGIPYASFGLVWKKYGEVLCGSRDAAEKIDAAVVAPIDGPDNGVATYTPNFSDVGPYGIHSIISSFIPTWKEKDTSIDSQFLKAVAFAKQLLSREIKRTKDYLEAAKYVAECYERSVDKRVIIIDRAIGRVLIVAALRDFSDPIYAVYPNTDGNEWSIVGITKSFGSFDVRKPLPGRWAGLTGEALQKMTGVPESTFCHTKRFLMAAKTKKSALALAQLALND